MATWRLLRSAPLTGQENLAMDRELFQQYEAGKADSTLRLYGWQPKCISCGYAQEIEKYLDVKKAAALGWEIVKRPTGGGIVFHNEAEVTYALVTDKADPLFPAGLVPAYKKISEAIVFALKKMGINAAIRPTDHQQEKIKATLCFAYPAEYEVVADGAKIVGSAQRRGRRTLLQQGSLFVQPLEATDLSVLIDKREKYLARSVRECVERKISREEIEACLLEGFQKTLGLTFKER